MSLSKTSAFSRVSLGTSSTKECSCTLNDREFQGIENNLSPRPRNPPKDSTAYPILPSSRSIINSSIFPRSSPAVLTTLFPFIVLADKNSGPSLPAIPSVLAIFAYPVSAPFAAITPPVPNPASLSFSVSWRFSASVLSFSSLASLSCSVSTFLSASILSFSRRASRSFSLSSRLSASILSFSSLASLSFSVSSSFPTLARSLSSCASLSLRDCSCPCKRFTSFSSLDTFSVSSSLIDS